jgi:hypothetical protein
VITVPEVVYQYPPEIFMGDCAHPVWSGGTYRDLVVFAVDLAASIEACNLDKAALREWVDKTNHQGRDQ